MKKTDAKNTGAAYHVMRRRRHYSVVVAIASLPLSGIGYAIEMAQSTSAPLTQFTCEYREGPLGIDVIKPRLGWKTACSLNFRGEKQTAYQLMVATTPELLAKDQGDLWDSGKVFSDQQNLVEYNGKTLDSRTSCFWKVRIWDKDGKPSQWSAPATWTMGLLHPEDWHDARWIGQEVKAQMLAKAHWIWTAETDPTLKAPAGTRYFQNAILIPADRKIKLAVGEIATETQKPFAFYVNGKKATESIEGKTGFFNITKLLTPGKNVFSIEAIHDDKTFNPPGWIGAMRVDFEGGECIELVSDSKWKIPSEKPLDWPSETANSEAWTSAKELGNYGGKPWKELIETTPWDTDTKVIQTTEALLLPARYLRREFKVNKKVSRATAYVSGLGLFEFHLNGAKVGDHVLEPGLTDYSKRCYYETFDVTAQVQSGNNAIGVILGNGRFWGTRWGVPRLIFQLALDYSDGSHSFVCSDESWRMTDQGPIRENSEFHGEEYDARKEFSGWDKPDFSDGKWFRTSILTPPTTVLSAQMPPPIRVIETLKPKAITNPKPGVYVYDMGQNMVGWCSLKVEGPAGTTVRLRFGERLESDGNIYTANLRQARSTDFYTLKGVGTELYTPRFTYHGFQFVEITGYPGTPDLSTIEGQVVHDDLQRTGEFRCSKDILNKIASNIFWGVRGNYRSIVTDCPQRDERQGWLGDRSGIAAGEASLFNIAPIYGKWLADIRDGQRKDGCISEVTPDYYQIYKKTVTWPSLAIIVPGTLYDEYGDLRCLQQNYPTMKKWMTMIATTVKEGITPADSHGDWCAPSPTAGPVIATCYLYNNLRLMARYATILGFNEDAIAYLRQADEAQAALQAKFYKSDQALYDNGSPTSSILPLYFKIAPENQRPLIVNQLAEKMTHGTPQVNGVGAVGVQWLMRALSDNGRPDIAYQIATRTESPSWGYMVSKGATTIWEQWNSDRGGAGMNSLNHVMLVGDLYIWMNQYLAGIRPDPLNPGYKHIIIRPTPTGDLTWVSAWPESPYGRITSNWKREADNLIIDISIPPNATATVYVPTDSGAMVTESNKPPGQSESVKFIRTETKSAVYEIGSGHYQFKTTFTTEGAKQ